MGGGGRHVPECKRLEGKEIRIPKFGLHLEGEDLAELGFCSDPTILATMELEAVA